MIIEPILPHKLGLACPCDSKLTLKSCCLPFITGEKAPKTPEQLMRSRYVAYALNQFNYILQTYAKKQRESLTIRDLSQDTQSTKWLKLTIHQSSAVPDKNQSLITPATVEFSAYYLIKDALFHMREKSYFIFEQQWLYVNGDFIEHEQLRKVRRNDICPCYALLVSKTNKQEKPRKFKNCCGK